MQDLPVNLEPNVKKNAENPSLPMKTAFASAKFLCITWAEDNSPKDSYIFFLKKKKHYADYSLNFNILLQVQHFFIVKTFCLSLMWQYLIGTFLQ